MTFAALIVLSPAGEITMLARGAFGIVLLLSMAVPVARALWSSLKSRPESDEWPDLDALWERYKRGEISWDEYLRGKVEGNRGLVGTKAGSSEGFASSDTS